MTANDTTGRGFVSPRMAATASDMVRRVAEWSRRLLIAFAIILAAGILAVFTALFGLVLAAVAILMRFAGKGVDMGQRRRSQEPGTITLEARRTGHGWTVE